ncbi:nuclear pore complex protein DDB_G0274915 isoform X2 [Drosophila ananassae]|nr:nuclear pore complex protein DDB_G0274915 isoform X2 [Drosophila ananassae]
MEQNNVHNYQNKTQRFQEADQYQNNERESRSPDEDIVFKNEKRNSHFNNRDQYNQEWNKHFQGFMIPNERHQNHFYKNWRVSQPIKRQRNRFFFSQNRNHENLYENFKRNNALQRHYNHQHQTHRYPDGNEISFGNRISNDILSDSRRNHRFINQDLRPNVWHNGNEEKHNTKKFQNSETIQNQSKLSPRDKNELLQKNVNNLLSQLSQEQLTMEKMIPKIRSIQNINKTLKSAKGQTDFVAEIREAQKQMRNIQRTLETEAKYKPIDNQRKSVNDSVSEINSKKGRLMFRSGQKDQEASLSVREKATNLIQKWAESQRLMVDSFVKAITEILKSHDLNPIPTDNVTPEKLGGIEDLLKQVVDAIKKLKEEKCQKPENGSHGSTNKDTKEHIDGVLQKWIETQKTPIDSFLDTVRKLTGLKPETKPGLESNASEIAMEDLIKRLRELIEHLGEQKVASSATTREQSITQSDLSSSTPKISSTTSELPSTHTPRLTTEMSHPTTESSSTSIQSTASTDKPPDTSTSHITTDAAPSTTESFSTSIPTTSSHDTTSIPSYTSTSPKKPSDTATTLITTDTSPSATESSSTSTPTASSHDTTSIPSSTSTWTDKPPETTTHSSSTTSPTSTSPTSTKTDSESTKTTESFTTSHSTAETHNSHEASITKLMNILGLLKKLRKILNTIVEKSDGKISPELIEGVRSMLNQIITGQVDLKKTNSAELEQLLSTTIKPNTSKGSDLSKEKLVQLLDSFEKLYQQLLGEQLPSTTESTTGSTPTTGKTTTESYTTKTKTSSFTTPLATDTTQSTINPSGAPSGTNNNYNISGNLDLKAIVDGIQQLKMAVYHDFNSFKKDQVDRMETIMKVMQDLKELKSSNKRTKPRTQIIHSQESKNGSSEEINEEQKSILIANEYRSSFFPLNYSTESEWVTTKSTTINEPFSESKPWNLSEVITDHFRVPLLANVNDSSNWFIDY